MNVSATQSDRKHKMDHAKHINICTTRNQESLTFHPFYVCTQDSFSPLNHSTTATMSSLQRPKVCSCTTEKSQTADCASNRQSGINNNKKLVGGLEKELRWSKWSTIDNQPTMQWKKQTEKRAVNWTVKLHREKLRNLQFVLGEFLGYNFCFALQLECERGMRWFGHVFEFAVGILDCFTVPT